MELYPIPNDLINAIEKNNKDEIVNITEELLIDNSPVVYEYFKNCDATLESVENEIRRLTNIKNSIKTRKEDVKQIIKEIMIEKEIKKITTPLGSLTLAKSPISIEVLDTEQVPKEFIQEQIIKNVDKNAIKKHFSETGEVVDGVRIITENTNLRVS